MPRQLSGQQEMQLFEALIDAFPSVSALAQMVRFGEVTRSLAAVAGSGTLQDVVFNLVVWAGSHEKLDELIVAARNANPGNVLLRIFAESVTPARESLSEDEFLNVAQWQECMHQSKLTVCRLELPRDTNIGTAFLLAPDLVMTNHHVMGDVIADPGLRDAVVLRFDYETGSDGTTLWQGVEYRFATDWLVDSSPPEELDYALLRVEGKPGKQPVTNRQGVPERGWLKPQAHTFEIGEPLLVLQRPKTAPLTLAVGSVLETRPAQHRIVYSANTLPGSSGSPCFTRDWDLVALHHHGHPTGNLGVIISAILAQAKIKAALGI